MVLSKAMVQESIEQLLYEEILYIKLEKGIDSLFLYYVDWEKLLAE